MTTALGEFEVRGLRPNTVRIALDGHLAFRMRSEHCDERLQAVHGSRGERRLARAKQDITQREHQTALRLPRIRLQGG